MCYLGKCVYVERQGNASSKALTINKLSYLLDLGQTVCIFPEGGRSRTGSIDRDGATYGIGQLIDENPDAIVCCLYLRGLQQDTFSNFPQIGDEFHIDLETIVPKSAHKGEAEIS